MALASNYIKLVGKMIKTPVIFRKGITMVTRSYQLLILCSIIIFSCNEPNSITDENIIPMTYGSVTGTNSGEKNISGSANDSGSIRTVKTRNADGLWSSHEEIGMYYFSKTVFNGTLSAHFESCTGIDSLVQGGLMIRSSLKSGAAYTALRLVKGIYDPVARLDSSSDAKASGSTVQYQRGDELFITCTEKEKAGTTRTFSIDIGAKRSSQVIISKTYTITSLSDSIYVGIFCADRSTSYGSFAVSKVTAQ
jgi:hypothetical protein